MNMVKLIVIGIVVCAATLLPRVSNAAPRVEEFSILGMRVILQHSENEIISAIIAGRGGFAYGETDNPALSECMAALTSSSGSMRFPKDSARVKLARLVTTISGGGDFYDVNYRLRCVRPNFNESWKMFVDMVLHPRYDSVEFARITQRQITQIRDRHSSPENYAYVMGDSALHSGSKRLGRLAQISDIERVTITEMRLLHRQLFQPGRVTLVVVGNIKREDLVAKLADFKDLRGGIPSRPFKDSLPPVTASRIVSESRAELPTTYIFGMVPSPTRTDSDFWAMRYLSAYLGQRLWEEVRTKRNLSYAPGSRVQGSMQSYVFNISVSTTRPDSAMGVMLHEVDRMRAGDFDKKQFTDAKNVFITRFYSRQLTNGSQADALYAAVRETGSWQAAFDISKVSALTLDDAKRVANKYLHHMLFSIVGPEGAFTPARFVFE